MESETSLDVVNSKESADDPTLAKSRCHGPKASQPMSDSWGNAWSGASNGEQGLASKTETTKRVTDRQVEATKSARED